MRFAVAAFAFASLATPAFAQSDFWAGVTADVIGQTMANANNNSSRVSVDQLCLAGGYSVQTSPTQFRRMREGAQRAMTSYLDLTRPGVSADASALYVRQDPTWTRITDGVATMTDVGTIVDPLAPHTAALAAPEQFLRAADGRTTAGLWLATNAAGATIGHYLGVFRRAGGGWKLVSLQVGEGPDVPDLTPYCHTPGDIDEYVAAQRATIVAKDEAAIANAGADSTMEGVQPLEQPPPQ